MIRTHHPDSDEPSVLNSQRPILEYRTRRARRKQHYKSWCIYQSLYKIHLSFLLGASTLLGQENGLDVGQNTTLGNCHACQQLVKFLVVPEHERRHYNELARISIPPDGKLQMPRDDSGLLVVPGGIASQLQNLSSQVLHDRSHVDWCTSANPLSIVAFPGYRAI